MRQATTAMLMIAMCACGCANRTQPVASTPVDLADLQYHGALRAATTRASRLPGADTYVLESSERNGRGWSFVFRDQLIDCPGNWFEIQTDVDGTVLWIASGA